MLDVDTAILDQVVADQERQLRGALVSMDLWDRESGLSLAGFNSQPAATALFNQVTGDLDYTLKESGFPTLNRFYLLDLTDGKLVVILRQADDFLGGMLLDGAKTNLGILLGVAVPKALKGMDDSRQSR